MSEDLCTEEVAFSCVTDVSEFSVVRILEKTAPDGAKLEGTATFRISDLDRTQSCVSTYDFVAERQ